MIDNGLAGTTASGNEIRLMFQLTLLAVMLVGAGLGLMMLG